MKKRTAPGATPPSEDVDAGAHTRVLCLGLGVLIIFKVFKGFLRASRVSKGFKGFNAFKVQGVGV